MNVDLGNNLGLSEMFELILRSCEMCIYPDRFVRLQKIPADTSRRRWIPPCSCIGLGLDCHSHVFLSDSDPRAGLFLQRRPEESVTLHTLHWWSHTHASALTNTRPSISSRLKTIQTFTPEASRLVDTHSVRSTNLRGFRTLINIWQQ